MKPSNDYSPLLDAVLLDERDYERSLTTVRRGARRRRWNRRIRSGAVALLLVGSIGILVWPSRRVEMVKPLPAAQARPGSVEIVISHGLAKGVLVKTESHSTPVVKTGQGAVESITTANVRPLDSIDDETLLGLAPGAVLVRHHASAELVLPGAVGESRRDEE
jgi:hypothetical protein